MTHKYGLKIRLESDEITLKVIHQIFHVFLGHSRIDHEVHRNKILSEGVSDLRISERHDGEVPSNVVRVWIRPDYVFEATGMDLIIICRVTPATNAGRGSIKEGRIVHVVRV